MAAVGETVAHDTHEASNSGVPSDTVLAVVKSLRFFNGIWSAADAEGRQAEMDEVFSKILADEQDDAETREEKLKSLAQHLPTIARIATECPFADVKARFSDVVEIARKEGLPVPEVNTAPSWFDDSHNAVLSRVEGEYGQQLLEDLFVASGGVLPHMEALMGWFPQYLECHLETIHVLMRADGPVKIPWRHYIAIMAASRYGCTYLVRQQEVEFLMSGGDPTWLQGLEHVPEKLAKLAELNAILAHQPWRCSRQHIEDLANEAWSVGELVHAICILCTYHALVGFTMGCGVTPEVDMGGAAALPQVAKEKENQVDDGDTISAIIQRNASGTNTLRDELSGARWREEDVERDKDQDFARAGEGGEADTVSEPAPFGGFGRYVGNLLLNHEDFDVSNKDYSPLRQYEFCWKIQGMALVEQFLPELASPMDREFDHCYEMTSFTLNGQTGFNTQPFRSAIWFYAQRIKGLCRDDFDYHLVNRLLHINIKRYVKKVACTPELLRLSDYLDIGYQFQPEEEVHINMLAIESRKQAELLHGLRAIAAYMKPA
mmetsp:Transcript_30714/g.70804  ORF Transcript_30714/g.70804 Transcript_30714/m.70804 type:complete len:547 (+) Transcript_30714:44-1684(+)|eukprot:CAMPEP_0114560768 /NCGR_PEP_ID=MMETSP0114-20121206/11636_1 /TAXON_ID=31324 /ORGANISM="Goniomonas sp, Strain m" /LENGTH=546 /DNA_ID=CAMNT_0001746337 /DNA_START=44 /DNA_END=1684 /DNA_ORIENTATION=+